MLNQQKPISFSTLLSQKKTLCYDGCYVTHPNQRLGIMQEAAGRDMRPHVCREVGVAAYQPLGLLHQRSVHAVHLVVEPAGVAEVVAGPVSAPKRRRHRTAVDALPTLRELYNCNTCLLLIVDGEQLK